MIHYLVFRIPAEMAFGREVPIGEVFAKNEDDAMKAWKDFMVDGPHNVELFQTELCHAVVIPFI